MSVDGERLSTWSRASAEHSWTKCDGRVVVTTSWRKGKDPPADGGGLLVANDDNDDVSFPNTTARKTILLLAFIEILVALME